MIKKFTLLAFLFIALLSVNSSFAQAKKTTTVKKATNHTATKRTTTKKSTAPKKMDNLTRVKITTSMGDIIVKLYDSTPLHTANFIKLVNEHFFDSLLFHRVIPQFMIQGGDPLSKNAMAGAMLGNGGGDMERIPAEFNPKYFHKRGALAGARDGNPAKASSACQFYIVQGKKYTADELNGMEASMGTKFSPEAREAYMTVGGTPFLDQNYTVFGEVESGMEIVDKIAATPRNQSDRPNEDVRMKMEIIK